MLLHALQDSLGFFFPQTETNPALLRFEHHLQSALQRLNLVVRLSATMALS